MTKLIIVFGNFVNALTTHAVLHFRSPDYILSAYCVITTLLIDPVNKLT